MQGFSGLKSAGNGEFWVLQDNGFGTRPIRRTRCWCCTGSSRTGTSGKVEVLRTIFVHDADRKVPFQITPGRHRRSAISPAPISTSRALQTYRRQDLDRRRIRSLPHPHRPERQGRGPTSRPMIDGKPARSPDHYLVSTPAVPGGWGDSLQRAALAEATRRMAASKDGRFLYPLLEGPLWDDSKKAWEMDGDREYLRILEFDVAAQKWTGRFWKYRARDQRQQHRRLQHARCDDRPDHRARQRRRRTADKACAGAHATPDCFNIPAKMKRIYKVELNDANAGGFVRKIGHLDLLGDQGPGPQGEAGHPRKASSPFRSSPSRGSTWWTIATSSSATTTTCRTLRAARSASRMTTS